MTHNIYLDCPQNFVVFNDQSLSFEEITAADLRCVSINPSDPRIQWMASCVWSADCEWYFVISDTGIYLLSVSSERGVFCLKKTARFIEWFLSSDLRHLSRVRRNAAP